MPKAKQNKEAAKKVKVTMQQTIVYMGLLLEAGKEYELSEEYVNDIIARFGKDVLKK